MPRYYFKDKNICNFFFLETKKQVLVWIHGGAFIFGGIDIYSPEYIMEEDIVLVTIQYRLVM